ncbi:MAG: hypothetical protein Q7S98_05200 [Deltaproteobacteria bacterium]|nr:hypothetical protein [Deltaproteobacteria bacterium]
MKMILALMIIVYATYGCIPVLIGGAFYKGSKTKGQRQEFTTQFQKTNMEREEKHLKPLDWCSEAYKFDSKWASKDKACAKRIKAYQSGDLEAIDMGDQKNQTQKKNP